MVADLRSDLYRHLTRLDASFFDRSQTGELVSRLTADTTQLKATFGSSASVALRNIFLFFGAVVMMVVSSPRLSGFVLLAIPLIVLPLVLSGRGVGRRSRAAQDRLAEAMAFATESLGAMRTVQIFGAETLSTDRFDRAVEHSYTAAARAARARSILTVVAIFLAFGSVVAVLWLGAPRRHVGTNDGRPPVAIRSLRGLRREFARAAERGLERNLRQPPAPPAASARSWPSRRALRRPPTPVPLPPRSEGQGRL